MSHRPCLRQAVYWTRVFQHCAGIKKASEAQLPAYTGDTPQSCKAVNSNSVCLTGASSTLPLLSLCASIKANGPAWDSKCNTAHFCKVKLTSLSTYWRFNIVRRLSWHYKPSSVSTCKSVEYVQYCVRTYAGVCMCVCVCVCEGLKHVIAGVRWSRSSVAAKWAQSHLVRHQ